MFGMRISGLPFSRTICCWCNFPTPNLAARAGNLFRTADGRLAYIDFGMMGEIDPNVRR